MKQLKLSEHIKNGDTLFTPFTNPDALGKSLSLTSWARDTLPDYYWIAAIIHSLGSSASIHTMLDIAKELKEIGITTLNISNVFKLEETKQKQFWSVVTEHVDIEVLKPLAVVITPEINKVFFDTFFDPNQSIDENISSIIRIAKECGSFHDDLSTDICYVVVATLMINEKLCVVDGNQLLIEAVKEYPKSVNNSSIRNMYGTIIRSAFQAIHASEKSGSFSSCFWNAVGELTDCKPLVVIWDEVCSMDYFKVATETIEFFSVSNEDKKLEIKYSVIMGMTCYIFRLYEEIVKHHLYNEIAGRILFRTMMESYINLKFLMHQEPECPDIYDRYIAYGYGKYKLVSSKLREGKYNVNSGSHINQKYIELLVNENISESFINISFGFFGKNSIKEKFEIVSEQELYEIYYEYTTNYSHGFWGAVRESSMLVCDNPAHIYHDIPDYDRQQKLTSVIKDCEWIMNKTFQQISDYITLPDFYQNYMKERVQ